MGQLHDATIAVDAAFEERKLIVAWMVGVADELSSPLCDYEISVLRSRAEQILAGEYREKQTINADDIQEMFAFSPDTTALRGEA